MITCLARVCTELDVRARLRRPSDTVGALVGPLLGIVLLAADGGDMRTVFAIAIIPGAVAVLLLHTPTPSP